jgi:hypothetical protein
VFGVQLHHLGKREGAANIDIADKDMLRRRRSKDGITDYSHQLLVSPDTRESELTVIQTSGGT